MPEFRYSYNHDTMKKLYKYFCILLPIVAAWILNACSELVTVDAPQTQTTFQTVFSDDQTATSAIAGIYSTMIANGSFAAGGPGSMTMQVGLSSDEYENLSTSTTSLQFSQNSLAATNLTVQSMWADL